MRDKENILRVLRKAREFIKKEDVYGLKTLSNDTIRSAAISQDGDDVVVAVLIYSISKVLERDNYRNMEGWKEFYDTVTKNLELAIKSLDKDNVENMRTYLGRIRNSLNKISGNLSSYIKDIFKRAEVNKAFKLYEHGLSTEKTAKLLGISLWDMASYIGQSHIGDSSVAITMPVEKRIKIAEYMFK